MSRNGEDISDNAEWQLREELTVIWLIGKIASSQPQAILVVILSEAKDLCTSC